jgi:RNA polymerase sigma factor (sigma-70 family)
MLMNIQNQSSVEIVEKLFNQFADRLYAFATRAWKFSEDDAWDTIYETLFHIAKVYHRYDFPDERRLTNFVITVFNNRLKNRRREKESEPILVALEPSSQQTPNSEIETTLGAAEKAVAEGLDELEEWERILLIQRSELAPYSEIEKLVGKPEEQLKVYYKRALAKLESIIKEKLSMEHRHEERS